MKPLRDLNHKRDHPKIQKGPAGMEKGQYRLLTIEHKENYVPSPFRGEKSWFAPLRKRLWH
jgi:hypothetical protein